jgi:azurin
MRIWISVLVIASAGVAAVGCKKSEAYQGNETPSSTPSPPVVPVEAPKASAPATTPTSGGAHESDAVTELKIESVAETMTYNLTTLTVQSGHKVHLVLKNNAKSPLMPHNWVLAKPGTEPAIALAGVNLKAAGYVAAGDADILAATPLALPGGTSEITFTAPAPGIYPYICTVPGHYMLMKGKLTVTP